MSESAVAAGCLPNLDEATTLTPHPNAQQIADGVAEAFAAYDLHVVNEPPPEYLPTFAVFTSSEPVAEATSYTCSTARGNCSARARDRGYFTNGGTQFCTDPDIVTSAVFAVGLMSGLEGKADAPDDWMNYPPDFAAPPAEFLDACGDIAPNLGGDDGMTPLPLQCTSLDHVGCDAAQQNSHADLLDLLGPRGGDEDAPIIDVMSPTDGDVIGRFESLTVRLTLEEASNYAGVRVTVSSDALVGIEGILNGEISFCTSDLCDLNWLSNDPFRTADSVWSSGELALPEGEYTIEIEASDYYGNEAEMVTLMVTVGDGPVDPTGGDTSTGGEDTVGEGGDTDSNGSTTSAGADSGGPITSAGDSGGGTTDPGPNSSDGGSSGSSGGSNADDTIDRGCSTDRTHGPRGSIVLMLGLLGLGLRRRR